jgi:MoaA/NifB/PqqE/SkfB family radical SAM enzyme
MDLMDKILHKYQNGNTTVTILEDGTKIREYEDTPLIVHPESLDCKISNVCNLNCPYCHEQSTINGKHADLHKLQEILDVLPAGVELALGGGNPLSHPDLYWFLQWLKNKGIIANITVNQLHLIEYKELLYILLKEDLIKGLGISIVNNDYSEIETLQKLTNNIVFHVIAGVTKLEQLNDLLNLKYCKILVLGYKQFGRGIKYYNSDIELEILHWKSNLRKYVNKGTLSFDNLAIEQLDIKSWFTNEGWSKFYMGDDFTFTMYIDAVEQNYAPTSRDDTRTSFDKMDLLTYFKTRNQ